VGAFSEIDSAAWSLLNVAASCSSEAKGVIVTIGNAVGWCDHSSYTLSARTVASLALECRNTRLISCETGVLPILIISTLSLSVLALGCAHLHVAPRLNKRVPLGSLYQR
jgi:hypothetical protein